MRKISGSRSAMFMSSRKMYACNSFSIAVSPFLTSLQFEAAKAAYRRVLERDPKHAKVLQQLGWLHHQQSNSYASQDQAIEYLEQSVSSGLCNNTHVRNLSANLPPRQSRCPKLVPAWTLLYGAAEISQSIRSLSASRVPRWSQPYLLVFHRRLVLPNQPVP